jgi:hypothetical protein
MSANYNECEAVGVDPAVVDRLCFRVERLLIDMGKHGLHLFCGSSGSIRCADPDGGPDYVVGDFCGSNHDGGCGAIHIDENGLIRGEGD